MRHQFIVMLMLVGTTFARLPAQDLQLSGYYENQFYPQKISGKFILQDYNKIRLDLTAAIGENMSFTGDYVYQTFHGKTTFSAADFIPAALIDPVLNALPAQTAQQVSDVFSIQVQDRNFLDNAYVSIYSDHFNLRIGKQQLPRGSGYTWNPTDIFNDKNALDPAYEKVGLNAFKLEIPFSSAGMITAIFSPEENFKSSMKAWGIKQHFAGFDLSLSFIEKRQSFWDLDNLVELPERRRLFGADFSGELFGLGFWGEGAHNRMEISDHFSQYLIGGDYTFENGFYITSEYYRNGLGKSDKSDYTLNDWLRLLSAQGENLGRDYIFFGGMRPFFELYNMSNFFMVNLNDGSGLVFPWVDYSLNDNSEIMFVGYIPFGGKLTEFGEFGVGGFARLRVYF